MTPARSLLQRGMAALTVVMVLFFIMALLAAYTNRNLVFEQRISANSYRATRALEAADAGVEWTIGMLNAGRITASCVPPDPDVAAAFTDFRSRYLVPALNAQTGEADAFGLPWGLVQANRVYPTCVMLDGVPSCACPAVGEAAAGINVPADGVATAFRVTFRLFNDDTVRGGAIQLVARGCSNPGAGDTSCIAQAENPNAPPVVDGTTSVIATLGLVRALLRGFLTQCLASAVTPGLSALRVLLVAGRVARASAAHGCPDTRHIIFLCLQIERVVSTKC